MLVAFGLLLAGGGFAQDPASTPPVRAVVLRLDGEIDDLTERSLELSVRRVLEDPPRFLVVSIASPGGGYTASRTIAWNLFALREHGVTTVAYVRGHALSGATLVAFGCDMIGMSPGAQLGDVMPIRPGVLAPQLAEKFVAPVRKDLERLATERGYPVDVAAAMVDPEVELHRVLRPGPRGRLRPYYFSRAALEERPELLRGVPPGEDRVVCARGKLLVIGPEEAADMGVARFFASSEQDLCRQLAEEFSFSQVAPEPAPSLWWPSLVRFLTWWPIKVLLFVCGLVAVLVAAAHPGLGAPELVAVLCFGAVFLGSYLIGLADWVEVLLLAAGLLLLGVEVFVTPGFGVVGGLGVLCVFAALLLSFQSFVIPATPADWDALGANLGKTALGFLLSVFGTGLALRYLPGTRLGRGLVHEHHLEATPLETAAHRLAPLGARGVARTPLRPVGRVRVGGQEFDARARDGLLPPGAEVVVVGHQGHELVVANPVEGVGEVASAEAEASEGGPEAASSVAESREGSSGSGPSAKGGTTP